jgi:hypothetical protein
MIKFKKGSVVRLSNEANESLNEMLKELSGFESTLTINNSKLISYIVLDYREKCFEKNKERIAQSHRNKRKDARTKLCTLSETELESVIKFLDKMNKEATSVN